MPGAELHFTLKDLEEWAKQGLITPEQLTRIRHHIETAESLKEQTQAAPEPRKRLNLISIAYLSSICCSWWQVCGFSDGYSWCLGLSDVTPI